MHEIYSLNPEQLEQRLRELTASMTWPSAERAIEMAQQAHEGQIRRGSKLPYIVHPIRVALLLLEVAEQSNAAVICAAILHDVLEDSNIPEDEIEDIFGSQVLDMVVALTHPQNKDGESNFERNKRMFENMRWADRDVQIIKSADRLDNLTTAHEAMGKDRLQEYLFESREMLLPLTLASNTALYHALNAAIQKVEAANY
ncbi:MAG: HD domain-containing protein [Planctomycetota bacterium]|jgi:(p)ppGpp synthase/HD superfamily hydrolase|nr:HD domain-containing protein [Planctomycetota bacterium]